MRDRAVHRVVYRVQRRDAEKAARKPRLVRRYDDPPVCLRQPRDSLEAAADRLPLRRRLDELIAVHVDRAVAVEDDQLHCASFEMSATRFIASRRSRRRARRFWRSLASSTITITLSKNVSTGALSTEKVFR